MQLIGNAWLADKFDLGEVPLLRRSFTGHSFERVEADGRIEKGYPNVYAVGDDPLEHVAFALKHELPNLELLKKLFRKLSKKEVERYVTARPTGQYTRQIGFFFELLTGQTLSLGSTVMTGNYVPALDAERVLTGATRKIRRWRVDDNLLGNDSFCPIVRLTPEVRASLARNWQNEIAEVLQHAAPDTLQRALSYLYAKETKSSFLIEREEAGPDRSTRFIAALRKAGKEPLGAALSETHLVTLQNTIVDPRYAQKAYRDYQNYVGETMPGLAERVHYVCPPPQFVQSLMQGLAECTKKMDTTPAVAQAAVVSFEFVFIHPFEDGNGRIHRFLLHDVLARRGTLSEGLVLPLSAAMLHEIKRYDAVLEAFSGPLLSRVKYELSDDGKMQVLNPEAVEDAWRYPDLTAQVAYVGGVMDQAVRSLPAELLFLERYDLAFLAARNVVDMPDKKLRLLMNLLHSNKGRFPRGKRTLFSELSAEEISRMETGFAEAFRADGIEPSSEDDEQIGKA